MASIRKERLAHQIRDEISLLVQRGMVKDPRLGFVTFSAVTLSKDLKYATVFVSVYGTEEETLDSLHALRSARGYLRTLLSKRLRIRQVPQLTFSHDDSIIQGIRMNQILQDIPELQRDKELEAEGSQELEAEGSQELEAEGSQELEAEGSQEFEDDDSINKNQSTNENES